jgi:hypothetical protein
MQETNNYFGFLTQFGGYLCQNSSEIGLQVMLFALAVSIQAENIIEIGRFKGSSTLALASALLFLDTKMIDVNEHCQRKDIDYQRLNNYIERKLYTIDPSPQGEALDKIVNNELVKYVEFIDKKSQDANLNVIADLILIDGDHLYGSCLSDVVQYVNNNLKVGGYFILHDYYGWYNNNGENGSPIKQVCDQLEKLPMFESILIDTKYMSFMVFRKKYSKKFVIVK